MSDTKITKEVISTKIKEALNNYTMLLTKKDGVQIVKKLTRNIEN